MQCNLSLTEEQQTIKYIHGLKYPIQERVALQDLYFIDEAQNKAMKVERLQNKTLPFKNAVERTSSGIRTKQDSTSSERSPARKVFDAPLAISVTKSAPITKGKKNLYA